ASLGSFLPGGYFPDRMPASMCWTISRYFGTVGDDFIQSALSRYYILENRSYQLFQSKHSNFRRAIHCRRALLVSMKCDAAYAASEEITPCRLTMRRRW